MTDIDSRIRDLSIRADLAGNTLVMLVDVDGSFEELWDYVTDPELLRTWSPVVPEKPLTEVGPNTSRETPDAEPVDAEVIAAVYLVAIAHRWGDVELHWSMEPGRLNLQTTLPSCEDAPKIAAGWHICFAVLDALLSGEDQPRIVGEDALNHGFEELRRSYEETLGESALSDPKE